MAEVLGFNVHAKVAVDGRDRKRLERLCVTTHAERFVLSIKSECLNRMIPLGENHLRSAIDEFMLHYHGERHHQGLGHRLLEPDETAGRSAGPVACRERVGGILRYYYREDVDLVSAQHAIAATHEPSR